VFQVSNFMDREGGPGTDVPLEGAAEGGEAVFLDPTDVVQEYAVDDGELMDI
jgi:hypothetical protein